jgi:hypothetical protein
MYDSVKKVRPKHRNQLVGKPFSLSLSLSLSLSSSLSSLSLSLSLSSPLRLHWVSGDMYLIL